MKAKEKQVRVDQLLLTKYQFKSVDEIKALLKELYPAYDELYPGSDDSLAKMIREWLDTIT